MYNTSWRAGVATDSVKAWVRLEDSDVLTAVFKNLAVGVIICDTGGHFVFFIDSCITNVLCQTQRKRAVVHEGTQQRRTALE